MLISVISRTLLLHQKLGCPSQPPRMGCQERFTCHDNYNRHITGKWCTDCHPKLVCDGGNFKHIMNSLNKDFIGEYAVLMESMQVD